MHAYTVGSAYAESQDKLKGTIAPGMLADFDVLSEDIFALDPSVLERIKIDTVVLGGRILTP